MNKIDSWTSMKYIEENRSAGEVTEEIILLDLIFVSQTLLERKVQIILPYHKLIEGHVYNTEIFPDFAFFSVKLS